MSGLRDGYFLLKSFTKRSEVSGILSWNIFINLLHGGLSEYDVMMCKPILITPLVVSWYVLTSCFKLCSYSCIFDQGLITLLSLVEFVVKQS